MADTHIKLRRTTEPRDSLNLDTIYGKIVALTKEYHFKEPKEWVSETKFPAGNGKERDPFSFVGSVFLQWWLTERGALIREQLAKIIIAFEPTLNGDLDSFVETIDRTMQNNVLDYRLFRADDILFMKATTLFELRGCSERELAERLWERMQKALSNSIADWLVIIPLPRVTSPSIEVGFDGIHLIARQDTDAWQRLASRYSDARLWDPRRGARDDKDSRVFGLALPETWLACEAAGTQRGANELAKRRIRTFLSLIFANASDSTPNLMMKSMDTLTTMCTQFSGSGARVNVGQVILSIGELMPPLLVDISVTREMIESMRSWYRSRSAATDELQKRATVASHFVHYAIIASRIIDASPSLQTAIFAVWETISPLRKTLEHKQTTVVPFDQHAA